MTALAGLWLLDGNPTAAAECRRMLAGQAIYGPDGEGLWNGGEVALGLRRFDLLPEDRFDHPPLVGAAGRFVLVADIRLDNRADLAASLDIDAAPARAQSDTALLLRAWERWGETTFDHLYGDYAFALWDGRDRRLVLARDGLGTRPLHYYRSAGSGAAAFVAFASMPKGLHALPDIPYGPDEARTAELLALMPEHGSGSFFKDIHRVESGHVTTITASGVSSRRHWRPRRPEPGTRLAADHVEAMREHLDRAVLCRLRGAGPQVATHLSAGLDSSAVTATAARLMAPHGGGVVAFTSVPRRGYDGPVPANVIADEGALAALTADLYPNLEHVLVPGRGATGPDLMDGMDRNVLLFERPIMNLCNQQWIDRINSLARDRGLRVLLSGTMGNMTLTYDGRQRLSEMAGQFDLSGLWREGRALVKARRMGWKRVAAQALGAHLPVSAWRLATRMRGRIRALGDYSALNPALAAEMNMAARAEALGHDLASQPRIDGFDARLRVMQRVDQGNFNKGVLGGWGIDTRDPTADRRLTEFCLGLPSEAFLSHGTPRLLARRALADRLPSAVIGERRMGRQAIDWHEGLTASRDAIRVEIDRLKHVPSAAAALDLDRLDRLLETWPEGGWEDEAVVQNYRLALMRGLVSGHFLRKVSRSNA